MNTKGYLFQPDELINRKQLDLIVESINGKERLERINQTISMMINQKALSEEATKRGLVATDEEVNQRIEDQLRMIDELGGVNELGGFLPYIVKEKHISLEQYFREYVSEQIRQDVLIEKLYNDIQKNEIAENQKELNITEEVERIIVDFKKEHKGQIDKLREDYGVSEIPESSMFF